MQSNLDPIQSKTVIFVHIPKTAGTTLNSIFSYQYGHRHIYSVDMRKVSQGYRHLEHDISNDQKERIRLVRGHIPFGWHGLFDGPVSYLTFLRDPIKRVISLYNYSKYGTRGPWHDLVAPCKNIEDFIASGVTTLADNAQVRQLVDRSVAFGGCTQDMLDEAKQNLEQHFSVVGLTERFDETLVIAKRVLGWSKPLFYLPAKVAAKNHTTEKVTDRIVSLIRERNDLDLQLYDYVSKRFDALVAKHQDDIDQHVRRLRQVNRLCAYVLPVPLNVYRSVRDKVQGIKKA